MKTTQRVIAVVVIPLLFLPAELMSQLNTAHDWRVLQQLPQGDKLRVELKQGKPVEGRYRASTDSNVSLRVGNGTQEILKADVTKIYLVSGKHIASTMLKGTGIGASTGADVVANQPAGCGGPGCGLLIAVGAVLLAIPGAIIGLIVGAHHHGRQLIYET